MNGVEVTLWPENAAVSEQVAATVCVRLLNTAVPVELVVRSVVPVILPGLTYMVMATPLTTLP